MKNDLFWQIFFIIFGVCIVWVINGSRRNKSVDPLEANDSIEPPDLQVLEKAE